ncbi:Rrf2 family transcriptional regulator, partial [Klebsiella pneumoniae]
TNIMVGYRQTNQKTDTGKTLTRWPVFVDHFRAGNLVISQRGPGGGYSPRGDDITVTEVITAVSKLPAHKTFEPILRALDDVRVSQLLRGDSPAP